MKNSGITVKPSSKALERVIPWEPSDIRWRGAVETRYQNPQTGNDIVHPIARAVDKCNRLVVGPNPTLGAK